MSIKANINGLYSPREKVIATSLKDTTPKIVNEFRVLPSPITWTMNWWFFSNIFNSVYIFKSIVWTLALFPHNKFSYNTKLLRLHIFFFSYSHHFYFKFIALKPSIKLHLKPSIKRFTSTKFNFLIQNLNSVYSSFSNFCKKNLTLNQTKSQFKLIRE